MSHRHIGSTIILVFILTGLVYGISVPTKGKVIADIGLNLREGPGTNYPIAIAIPFGSVVDIVSTSGIWYKVNYGSYTGKYCSSTYLEIIETREAEQEDAAKYPYPTLVNTDLKRPAVSNIDPSTLP